MQKDFFDLFRGKVRFFTLPEHPDLKKTGLRQIGEQEAAELNRTGCGIFFAVNELRPGASRRTVENVVRIRAFFADCDDGLPGLDGLPLKPTVVVRTSNGRGHLYYILKEPSAEALAVFRGVQRSIVKVAGGDPACIDPPRVMRAPGTAHWKTGEPQMVEAEIVGPLYDLDEIVAAYPPETHQNAECGEKQNQVDTTAPTGSGALDAVSDGDPDELQHDLKRLRACLDALDPDADYDQWLRMLQGTHHRFAGTEAEVEAYEMVREWSAKGSKYDPSDWPTKWKSFRRDGDSDSVTFATVIKAAKEAVEQRILHEAERKAEKLRTKASALEAEARKILKRVPVGVAQQLLKRKAEILAAKKLSASAMRRLGFKEHVDELLAAAGKLREAAEYAEKAELLEFPGPQDEIAEAMRPFKALPKDTSGNVIGWLLYADENGNLKQVDLHIAAARIAKRMANSLRHDPVIKGWYSYNAEAGAWVSVDADCAMQNVYQLHALGTAWDGDRIGEGGNLRIKASESAHLIALIRAEHAKLPSIVDENRVVGRVPFKNGVLDTKSGELLPLTPDTATTWNVGVEYSPSCGDPVNTLELLNRMFNGDQDKIRIVRAYTAALLRGTLPSYQKILILVGKGGTGKSTLADILKACVGPDGWATLPTWKASSRFAFENVVGKRLIYCPEADSFIKNANAFKMLTGETSIEVERKNRPSINVPVTFGVLLASNDVIRTNDASGAFARRRIDLIIDGPAISPEQKTDFLRSGGFEAHYLAEVPAIVRWALELSEDDVSIAFADIPESIEQAVEEAEDESNALREWMRENVVYTGDEADFIPRGALTLEMGRVVPVDTECLYPAYVKFARETMPGSSDIGAKAFSRRFIQTAHAMGWDKIGKKRRRFGGGAPVWGFTCVKWSDETAKASDSDEDLF